MEKFVNMDMFGHAISVNYRGSDVYRTKLGAFVTLATYILMVINTLTLVTAFNDGSKQEES